LLPELSFPSFIFNLNLNLNLTLKHLLHPAHYLVPASHINNAQHHHTPATDSQAHRSHGDPLSAQTDKQHQAPITVITFSRTHVAGAVLTSSSIKCRDCNIQKSQAQYSAKRLEDLRAYIIQAGVNERDFQPSDTGFVRCTKCVGGPAVEHECYHCNITFPRTVAYFSKNMLKNRKDEAVSFCYPPLQVNLLTIHLHSSVGPAPSASRTRHLAAVKKKAATTAVETTATTRTFSGARM
jgi:hypothetical protein